MTKRAPTAAERCTSILLHEIFDYLLLQDFLHVMCVNRLWLENAINHPTYYGNLYLIQQHPLANVEFFLLRLSRSDDRPISIDVDLGEQTPWSLMQEIGNHLSHINSLTLCISSQHSVALVLQYLCRPAPILRNLKLRLGVETETPATPPPPSTLPANLLAGHGPVLDSASLSGFDLSSGIPQCFSRLRALSFYSVGWHELVLPNPFERCPKLEELYLGNTVTLHPDACSVTHAWNRMSHISFVGFGVASRWPAFGLPLQEVKKITVRSGDVASALALADTLSGPLHVTFTPPQHHPRVEAQVREPLITYTAILRNMSLAGDRSRVLEGIFSEHQSISAFSMPSLLDRVVRLTLPLEAWDDFVGLSTFGPFTVLGELVLNLKDGAEFNLRTALPNLSTPKLQRLVLHSGEPSLPVDVADVAKFARSSLSETLFPLQLEVVDIALTGACNSFRETFSGCICHGILA